MRIIIFIIVLLFPIMSFAQDYLFAPAVNDARARGMGRTEILNTNGGNGIFVNPANLSFIDSPTVQAGGRLFFGIIDDEPVNEIGAPYQYWEAKYTIHLKLTHISFAMPVKTFGAGVELVFGIGYNSYFDNGRNYKREYRETYDGFSYDVKVTGEEYGGLNTISPALAVKVNDWLSFGLAFNKSVFGETGSKYTYDYSSPPLYSYVMKESEMKNTGSAYYFTFGQVMKITRKLTIGFMWRSDFKFEFREGELYQKYLDGDEWESELTDVDWNIPAMAGIGVNYRITPTILLAGEYQTRPLAGMQPCFHEGGQSPPPPSFFYVENGACYRLGGEFLAPVPFRVGIFHDAVKWRDDWGDESPAYKTGVTGGVGFEMYGLHFDLFGEAAFWGYDWGLECNETQFTFGMTAGYCFR